MTIHRIVCLANSRKAAGRCVAGKHTDSGLWLRPVSGRRTAEISDAERRYEDGTSALRSNIFRKAIRQAAGAAVAPVPIYWAFRAASELRAPKP